MSKDELLRIINNKNTRDIKIIFKLEEGLYNPTRNCLSKLKREKTKKSQQERMFKSKIEDFKKNFLDSVIDREEKIEKIKKGYLWSKKQTF